MRDLPGRRWVGEGEGDEGIRGWDVEVEGF